MKALSSSIRPYLSSYAEGMDAALAGVDATAGEDYAEGAGIMSITTRFNGEEEEGL
jgi:hypothetical protein